jgi:hypothetical protein
MFNQPHIFVKSLIRVLYVSQNLQNFTVRGKPIILLDPEINKYFSQKKERSYKEI